MPRSRTTLLLGGAGSGKTILSLQFLVYGAQHCKEPRRALVDNIFLTPTLIKLAPSPVRRIVGTLNHTQTVLLALGLKAVTA